MIGKDPERVQTANAQREIERAMENGAFEDAARRVAEMPPGTAQEASALRVLNEWMNANPTSAAAWSTQFAEGPLRMRALAAVRRHLGLGDQTAGSAWLETLPSGASKESAISAYVTGADGGDIRLAMEWANRHEDMEARIQQLGMTGQRWLRENNAAARAWIENAELPPGFADRLLGK